MSVAHGCVGTPDTLEELYAAIAPLSMDVGWRRTPGPQPEGKYAPGNWRYADSHAALTAAGRLIGPDLAERRNLLLMNPGGANSSVATMIAAYQMVLPGERARSHRHSANALRLVLDTGADMYTIVDGVRLDMHPGDVVLTPSWCWHGHANDGADAACFIDYLDTPLCRSVQQYVFEPYPDDYEMVTERGIDSPYVYPWVEINRALDRAPDDLTGHFARQIVLDRYPMKTIGLTMSRLSAASPTVAFSASANNIYSVVEGGGHSVVDGHRFAWERGDVFVAPAGLMQLHESDGEAALFCVNDEPLVSALGFLSR